MFMLRSVLLYVFSRDLMWSFSKYARVVHYFSHNHVSCVMCVCQGCTTALHSNVKPPEPVKEEAVVEDVVGHGILCNAFYCWCGCA